MWPRRKRREELKNLEKKLEELKSLEKEELKKNDKLLKHQINPKIVTVIP